MKLLQSVTVLSGNNPYTLDLSNYDEIRCEHIEYEEHTELFISFHKGDLVVRRLFNAACDVVYLPEPQNESENVV